METHSGHCLCGSIRFSASNVERHHDACHCGMCRRWCSGPMFATTVGEVSFSGEENLERYKSSEWAERGFCKRCGSHLFYFLVPANKYFIAVGAFDEPSIFTLSRETFIDYKPIGYDFAGDHQRWTEAQTIAQFS